MASPTFLGGVGRVVESIGTDRFAAQIFDVARRVVGCDHISAYEIRPQAPPRFVLGADYDNRIGLRRVANDYATLFWRHDPALEALGEQRCADGLYAAEIEAEDIRHLAYRSECYSTYHLRSRLSLYRLEDRLGTGVSFYCDRPFVDLQRSTLFAAADLILSLIVTHDALIRGQKTLASPDPEARLGKLASQLSPREREVCALIVTGHTSEAIALQLGIGLNTVLTHRKRAYAKLRISSQNELFRLTI